MKTRLWNTSKLVLAVILASLFIGLSGCSPKTAPPASPAYTPVKRATPISAVLEPDKSPSRVSQFQTKGNLNLAGATFLALTRWEAVSTHENLYQFSAAFPTGARAEVTLRLIPGQQYTPTAEERAISGVQVYLVSQDHSLKDGSCQVKLKYFLPQGAITAASKGQPRIVLSPNLVLAATSQLLNQASVHGETRTVSGGGILAQSSGGENGIVVELVAAVIEGGKQLLGTIEGAALEGLLGLKDENPFGTAIDSGMNVIEALNMSLAYQEMVAELDALQAEAENPTNPLTQKAYAEDPGVKQRILDEIANARSEMKMDCLVDYLNTEISVALGLVGSPALSIAVAPITTWNARTVKQVMRERIQNIRKMITRGIFSTSLPPTKSEGPSSSPASGRTDSSTTTTLPPGTWSASYENQHKTASSDGRTTIIYTDKGTILFTVQKNGSITGTGKGHLILHGADPHKTSDGETDYSFTVTGMKIDGKIQFNLEGAPNPSTFPVTSVSSSGHRETSPLPVTAPLMLAGPVELKHGGKASVNNAVDPGGMKITFTGTLTIN